MDISRFKADHQVIAKGIADLRLLVQQGLAQNADRIVEHLHQLSAKIKLHLNAEDAVLYPALMRQSASAPAETDVASAAESAEKLKADIDDLLDEIDEVLEANAEEFVKNYVQKGGE